MATQPESLRKQRFIVTKMSQARKQTLPKHPATDAQELALWSAEADGVACEDIEYLTVVVAVKN